MEPIQVEFDYQDFNDQYVESLRLDFEKFDADKNGRLDKKEFIEWLSANGTKKSIAKNIFEISDVDDDGSISFDEFKEYSQKQQNYIINGEIEQFVKMVFDSVDKNPKTGKLDKKKFVTFMERMNTPVGFFKKTKIFKQYDMDKSGTVEFDEILSMINFKNSKLTNCDD